MQEISDYTILDKVAETRRSMVFRAKAAGQDRTVIIKALKAELPSPAEIARFKQEYELIRNVDIDGIIKTYAVLDYNDSVALVLEDFEGTSLREMLDANPVSLKTFIEIGIKLAETLGHLHAQNIVHKDIKPNNILVSRDHTRVKLTDFGIAAEFTHANDEIYYPDVIEGTLGYISPEQTGRMNRRVDYRTDLYSLGITFYELLTRSLPFVSQDPLEILHSHIAREPVPPMKINRAVPEVISRIVMKLLAKTAEERYQNSFTLARDLEECLRRLNQDGHIESFPIAAKDVPMQFTIPETLFGRKKETDLLLDVLHYQPSSKQAIGLVTGRPGIGKTALIQEIQKTILARKGFFISGRYDPFQKNVPYHAIIQAILVLCRRIVAESRENISVWREKLNLAVGPNGKVITDIIPDVELIMGPQPPVPVLNPEESQNRLNRTFQQFIRVFARPEHPLVFFVDDLQWAEPASLKMIQTLILDPENDHLFFIGAYRDTEVDEAHPLAAVLANIREKRIPIKTIHLGPLDAGEITLYLAELFKCEPKRATPLADTVAAKTGGNPFFINQFLRTLSEEKLIHPDPESGWQWDLEAIGRMQVTDNVVDLMAQEINRMDEQLKRPLQISACIGSHFDPEITARLMNQPLETVLSHLMQASRKGFVHSVDNGFMFGHNRIQEAAYSLLAETEKSRLHFEIGRLLLERTKTEKSKDAVFAVVNQINNGAFYFLSRLNEGVDLLSDPEYAINPVLLNLKAGKKAKETAAYTTAVNYLRFGMSFLPENRWAGAYELTLALYMERAECEYLLGNFDQAQQYFEEILVNTRTSIDKAGAYNLMIILHTNVGELKKAVSVGREALALFGVDIPESPSRAGILKNIIFIRLIRGRRRIQDLAEMPPLSDPALREAVNILSNIGTPAYYLDPLLFAYIITQGVRIYLKNGICDLAPFAFIAYGLIISRLFQKYEEGDSFAQAGLDIMARFAQNKFSARSYFTHGYFVQHWRNNAKTSVHYLELACRLGLESGDLIYTGHSINAMTMYRIMIGDNLTAIFKTHEKHAEFLKNLKDPFIAQNYQDCFHIYRCLSKSAENPDTSGDAKAKNVERATRLKQIRDANNPLALFLHQIKRLMTEFVFANYTKCLEIAQELEPLRNLPRGTLYVVEYDFLYALTLTQLFDQTQSRRTRRRYGRIIRQNQSRLRKWAANCKDNFLHKYLLVKAEQHRLAGRFGDAAELYHRSVTSARENGYVQNEALANELAGKFYLARDFNEIARMYLSRARHAYLKWGADIKVDILDEKYTLPGTTAVSFPRHMDTSTTLSGAILDLAALRKSLKAIAEEKIYSKMLAKTIKSAIEFAGAQKGILLLRKETASENPPKAAFFIEAVGSVGSEKPEIMQSIALESADNLSHTVVNYVRRTSQSAVIHNAQKPPEDTDNLFPQLHTEAYIQQTGVKSILCLPITAATQAGAEMVGLLYLENNLASRTFTAEKIETLEIICLSAAGRLELSRKAMTDGLTGLFNHDYFKNMLHQEILLAQRHGRQLSLVMLDIDHFKKFNDTWGHQIGDRVLQNVAETLQKTCRSSDIVARYGGEEMAVVLCETDSQNALEHGEKLRAAVEANPALHPEKNIPLNVTISVGVASFPVHAGDGKTLIQKADEALYVSKENGRNQVNIAK